MKLYGAIDLHSNNNVTVMINEQDQVVYQKRLPNNLSVIAQELSTYRISLQGIVVESTYNWYWLVDGLMEKGHRVHLANTTAIRLQPNGIGQFFGPTLSTISRILAETTQTKSKDLTPGLIFLDLQHYILEKALTTSAKLGTT